MKIILFIIISTVFMTGCSSIEVSKEGKSVKVQKNDPPSICEELGNVAGSGGFAGTEENAKADIRNTAAGMGANYVRIETIHSDSKTGHVSVMKGTAYKCPNP